MTELVAEGPYFDELSVGEVFNSAPSVTLTSGLAAAHQAIVGDRLRLPLDETLCRAVTGGPQVAHPGLVWDVAIGQSTLATHHVKANLFYRGLVFRTVPVIGDTLATTTQVVALRQNKPKPDRRPTGLAVLRITTVDHNGRPVLDFWRCAMLPLRHAAAQTGMADDLDSVGSRVIADNPAAGWDLEAFQNRCGGTHFAGLREGMSWRIGGGDVVSSAPELARLTLNIAQVHHDAGSGGRLVYGGHTIGIALSQATRALPNIVTVAGWHSCDHLGPVREGDTLHSTVTVEKLEAPGRVHLRTHVTATGSAGEPAREVLDWRFVAIMA